MRTFEKKRKNIFYGVHYKIIFAEGRKSRKNNVYEIPTESRFFFLLTKRKFDKDLNFPEDDWWLEFRFCMVRNGNSFDKLSEC